MSKSNDESMRHVSMEQLEDVLSRISPITPDSEISFKPRKPRKDEDRDVTFSTVSRDDPAQQVVNLLAQALQNITSATPKSRPVCPCHYYGFDYERPTYFISRLQDYFNKHDVIEDDERISIAIAQLRGSARTWYEPYQHLAITYDAFVERFLAKFNSTTAIADAKTRLYGERQRENEPVMLFITKKQNLFSRFQEAVPQKLEISIIKALLLPEIKYGLQAREFTDIEEFITNAVEIEETIRHFRPLGPRPSTSQPRDEDRRPPGPNQRSPPPCRECGGRHFGRECHNRQGNGPRVGENISPRNPPTSPASNNPQ
uniref:Ty3 transposon capsid-like protein domain-containing protein n=1 Tax=Anoplophora glabripennis TaxID=217634 RepID=V5G005_ANOGL